MKKLDHSRNSKLIKILYSLTYSYIFLVTSCATKSSSIDPAEACLIIAEESFPRRSLIVTEVKEDSCYLEIKDGSQIDKNAETFRLVGPRRARVDLIKKEFFLIPRR